jgi:phytoene synthase
MNTNIAEVTDKTPVNFAPHHLQYCLERSAGEGSSLYYALLFCSPELKKKCVGLATFARELQMIPVEVHDPQVARIKLAWWKTEMDRAALGQATHPACLCLGESEIAKFGADAVALVVQSVSDSLELPRYFTQTQWDAASHNWGGELYAMAAKVAGTTESESLQHIKNFGACAMKLAQLLALGKTLGEGWHPFPVDTLQKAGVSVEKLRQRVSNEAFLNLYQGLTDALVTEGQAHWQALPRAERLRLRPLRALWRMRTAELALLKADGYPVLTQGVKLTPLRKLWIAWSTQVLRR